MVGAVMTIHFVPLVPYGTDYAGVALSKAIRIGFERCQKLSSVKFTRIAYADYLTPFSHSYHNDQPAFSKTSGRRHPTAT